MMKKIMPFLSMLLVAAVTMTGLTVAVKADAGNANGGQAGSLVYPSGEQMEDTALFRLPLLNDAQTAKAYTVYFDTYRPFSDILYVQHGNSLRMAYCYNERLPTPEENGSNYAPPAEFDGQEYDSALEPQVRAVLSAGYPIDALGLRARYGMNDGQVMTPLVSEEFAEEIGTVTVGELSSYTLTQQALWYLLNGLAREVLAQNIAEGTDDTYLCALLKEALSPSGPPEETPVIVSVKTGEAPVVAFTRVEGEEDVWQSEATYAKGYSGELRFTGLPDGLSLYTLQKDGAENPLTCEPAEQNVVSTSRQFVFRCDTETARRVEELGYLSFVLAYRTKQPEIIYYYQCLDKFESRKYYQNLLSYHVAEEETLQEFPVAFGEEPEPDPAPDPVYHYSVTYHENGGDPNTIPNKETRLDAGTHPLLAAPLPQHDDEDGFRYTFLGWSLSSDDPEHLLSSVELNDDTAPPDGRNIDVYAIWKTEKIYYNIYYDANGGDPDSVPYAHTKLDPGTYPLSEAVPTHPPAADGSVYDFKGWGLTNTSTPAESVRKATVVDRDVTVYAIWEKHVEDPVPPTPEPPAPVKPSTPSVTPGGGSIFHPPIGDPSVDFPSNTEITDGTVPLGNRDAEEVTEIPDETVPLGMIPQTGDDSNFGFAAALLALSLGGMAALAMVLKRLSRRERAEDGE